MLVETLPTWLQVILPRHFVEPETCVSLLEHQGVIINSETRAAIAQLYFELPSEQKVLHDLVTVTGRDLGFDAPITRALMYKEAYAHGLSTCPDDVVVQAWLQSPDNKDGELFAKSGSCYIAIKAGDGDMLGSALFKLIQMSPHHKQLTVRYVRETTLFRPEERWLFRRA